MIPRDCVAAAGAHGAEVAHADVIALVSQPTQPVRNLADATPDREAALLAQREATSTRYGKRATTGAAFALAGCLALLPAALVNSGAGGNEANSNATPGICNRRCTKPTVPARPRGGSPRSPDCCRTAATSTRRST
jgi:hypothetical protein